MTYLLHIDAFKKTPLPGAMPLNSLGAQTSKPSPGFSKLKPLVYFCIYSIAEDLNQMIYLTFNLQRFL